MTDANTTDQHEKDLAGLRRALRSFGILPTDSMSLRDMTKLLRLDYQYAKYHQDYSARQAAIKDISNIVLGFRKSDSSDDVLVQMSKIIGALK